MANPALLKIAYAANILILVPVCWSMFTTQGTATVFNGTVDESAGLRLLVGSLWTAILCASVAGLFAPQFFAPLLLVQIFYKSLWLLAFILPLILAGKPWPFGIAACFAAIVVTYPFLFWFGSARTG
jgi:hypothetical protein